MVITYFGGDSKTGNTMIAQSVAELLGKRGNKVLLMLLSCNYGTDYINCKKDTSIDDIKANIKSGNLTKEDVLSILAIDNGIHVLPGIKDITAIKYYDEKDVCKLTELMKSDYDYIIIDGGYDLNYGLTVSSLLSSDRNYFVITQQEKCIRRFKNEYYTVLLPLNIKGKLIVNKYLPEFGEEALRLVGDGDSIAVDYSKEGKMAELKASTLLNDSRFKTGIDCIVRDITGIDDKKNRFGFLNRG